VMAVLNSAQPGWEWASALGAVMIQHWANPPELSRPLQTLELRGITVGTDDDETFDRLERQALLEIGASTFHVDADGTVRIDRIRTLRKTNAFGDPDASWADAITMFQAMYFVRSMRAYITSSFPRCALSNFPTGINGFTSPPEIRQALIHNYKRLEGVGLVENSSLFDQYLVVERNAIDPNRVDVLMRPDFINQLRVVAVLVETHLELTADDILVASAA
jgi:phage tail sheath gpL-like